jgi:hypothetical protein
MATFGYTTAGTTNTTNYNALDEILGSKFTLSTNGLVSKITVYGDFYPGYTNYAKAAIYNTSLDLVAETITYQTNNWSSTTWRDLEFSSLVSLSAGDYWLVFITSYIGSSNATWLYYDTGTTNQGIHKSVNETIEAFDSSGWTFPSSLTDNNPDNVWYDTHKFSIYATYTTTNRYWVGGTGNWSDTAHWSETSGGTSGAGVPTAACATYFDANSFSGAGQTCTINTAATCLSLDFTGVTNSPTIAGSSDITIADAFTTAAGITWSHSGNINLTSTGAETLTANSIDFNNATLVVNGAGSTWTLQDALTITNGTLKLTAGTLNTNGQAVTIKNFDSSNTNTRTLTCGASAFTITGNWDITTATNLTLTEGTSTITLSGNNTYFKGGAETYATVVLTGTPITITGSNTFGTLQLTAAKQLNLTAGTTQTVTTFTATGTSGNVITIRSTTAGSAATLSKASGTVTCDYLDLKDSTAAGGATWKPGDNSTDSGNNTGWAQTWTNPTNAYSSDNAYATHTSPNGILYVMVTKDGGTTWQNALSNTYGAVEGYQVYGDGTTELWGTSWTGADVADANFKVKIIAGSSTSFNSQIYGSFAFDGEVAAGQNINGIQVSIEGKYATGTLSVDHLRVCVYYGDAATTIAAGSLAFNSTEEAATIYTGSAWSSLLGSESPAFSGTVTISNGGLESEQGIVSNGYLRGGKMYVDHIEEHTHTHGIVLDDGMYVDHMGEATAAHTTVFDDDVTVAGGTMYVDHIAENTGSHGIVLDDATTINGNLTVNGSMGAFADRGDPAAKDYAYADLTHDNAAHDLDLSGVVPAGATAVALYVTVLSGTAGDRILFRKNGNSNLINISRAKSISAVQEGSYDCIVPLDSNRVIEYYSNIDVGGTCDITVKGWWF